MSITQAFEIYKSGDNHLAAELCQQIIDAAPNSDAYHILGVIENDRGDWDQAVKNLTAATQLDPDNSEIWYNLSLAWRAKQDWLQVLESTFQCLTRKSDLLTAWICRAEAFCKLETWDQVELCWQCIREIGPNQPDSLDIIGVGVLESHQYVLAETIWNDIIAWFPQHAAGYVNRSVLYYNQSRYYECIADCHAAQKIDPSLAWQNMGSAYQGLNEFELGLACYDKALSYNPDNYENLSNRSVILNKLSRNDEAIDSANRSLQLKPRYPAALNNRGVVYVVQNKIELAERDFETVLQMDHNNKDAFFNLGICKFKQEKWISGWEYWDHRLILHSPTRKELYDRTDIAIYNGSQNLQGKTILIHHEQGFGDSIQFIRYSKWLNDQGARVVTIVPPALMPLLDTVPWCLTVKNIVELLEFNFDYQCAMMSLPQAQGINFSHQPCAQPYLFADAHRQKHWADRLPQNHKLRVAVAWGGNPNHSNNVIRNIPLENLAPLFKLPVDFVCVQNNPLTATEKQIVDRTENLWIPPQQFTDFQDTAAIINQCDLTVSVDTSVLHVSGALDKPTWAMLPFASCWRWGSYDTTTTPWYPRMTLFRQAQAQDWISVVQPMSWQLLNML